VIYEWDENKCAANLAKHGVDFAIVEDFEWDTASVEPDTRKDYGEPRFIATGYIGTHLYVLVFTPRKGRIRVIGLRKANPREVKRYETQA
jgi:uncharacterized protein